MKNVVWKTLIYDGEKYDKFEISNTGLIRNAVNKKNYQTCVQKNGYVQVCVSLGGKNKKKVFKIHRAVAETFIQNIGCKPDVNHIDGNKQNNCASNLEWVTKKENMQHAAKTGLLTFLSGTDNPSSKLTYEDGGYIRNNYVPYSNEYGTRGLGRKFNVDHETIRDIIRNNTYKNI